MRLTVCESSSDKLLWWKRLTSDFPSHKNVIGPGKTDHHGCAESTDLWPDHQKTFPKGKWCGDGTDHLFHGNGT